VGVGVWVCVCVCVYTTTICEVFPPTVREREREIQYMAWLGVHELMLMVWMMDVSCDW